MVCVKSKKAQLEWIFFSVVFILVIAIMIPVGGSFVRSINQTISTSGAFDTDGTSIVNTVAANYDPLWDNMFLFIFVGAWLGLLVAFYFVNEHPVMAIFMIIFIVLFLVLAPILSNIFAGFSAADGMETTRYQKTKFIMDNYLSFAIALGLSCMGVLYAKGRLS